MRKLGEARIVAEFKRTVGLAVMTEARCKADG